VRQRAALIDADPGVVRALSERLEGVGWEIRVLTCPVSIDGIVADRLGAIVVDLTLLGSDPWEYLERLRAALPDLVIVVCTGPSTVAQRVLGLRLGADDWLTKPCHPDELVARVEAGMRRLRRAGGGHAPALVAADLEIRPGAAQAFVRGESVGLTRREFELLSVLARSEGRVLEREEIYQRVWGYAMVRGDRSVDVFVRKVRLKLEQVTPDWSYVHTHFGVGYRFAPASARLYNEITSGGARPDGLHRDGRPGRATCRL
jgi:DNA-binding response OmpR family regulator